MLDDATIDRVERVHTEQMEFVDIYTQQIRRWRDRKTVGRPDAASWTAWTTQNQQLRDVTADVLALAGELRKGTIERVMGMSDLELGLQALLGNRPLNALTRPSTLRAIRYRALLRRWAFHPNISVIRFAYPDSELK